MGCKLIETSDHIRTKNQAHVLEHFWQHAQKKLQWETPILDITFR